MIQSAQAKTIYLIRHGQTKGNVRGDWLGAKSVNPLNKHGEKQARWTAKFLKEKNVDISKIFSSPTPRALMHAEILQKRLDIPIEKLHALTEIDLGLLEDKTRIQGLKLTPDEINNWEKNLKEFEPPLGESALEALERFYEIIKLIVQNYEKPDIIIITHGVVIKMFLAKILKESMETGETKLNVPWTNHGSITVIKYDNNRFRFIKVIENKHPDSKKVAAFG